MPFTAVLPDSPTASDLREQLRSAGDYLIGLQRIDRASRDASFAEDVRSAVDFIHAMDPALSAIERGVEPTTREGTPRAGTAELSNPGYQTVGQMVTNDERYTEFARERRSNSGFLELSFKADPLTNNTHWRDQRALIDSDPADGGVWRPVGSPVEIPPRIRQRRLFIRDVINVQETGLSSVPYIRELNALDNEGGASAVAEGAAKPEVTMQWDLDEAMVRKIAAWIPATTEIIEDAPTLRGYIDGRLSYMLAVREELDVMNGNGTAPNIKGILQFAGVQTQAALADVAQTLGVAIGLVENVDGEGDGIVMNPVKYWMAVTTRHATQFDGGFGMAGPGTNGAPFMTPPGLSWGLPVIRSRGVALNKAIVGSWALGATLFERMQTTIRVGNQHSDYFVSNKVVILAEKRVALAVHRPDFFVDVTLPT